MYDIKNADGSISPQKPIDGAWYGHFIIKSDDYHESGNIGQCHYIDTQPDRPVAIEFLDEDGEPVNMMSDEYPCYLVRQP